MAKQYPYGKGDGTVRWVPSGWLEDHLGDEDIVILDCQPNIHEYIQDHVPGAIYVPEGLFRIHAGNIPVQWIPPEAVQILFRIAGLDAEKPVVVYSGSGPLTTCGNYIGDGLEQTMLAYSLARYGHRNVLVLDGGFEKWKSEGRPLTRKFRDTRPSRFTCTVREDFLIGYNGVREMKDRPDVVLLDARPSPVYEGQGPWIKPGHIPGAVSLPWKTLMDDANKKLLRPDDQIAALVHAAGAVPEKTIICSCGTGREATNEFLLFRWCLGYPKVFLYEGGFTEWSSFADNPVVTGKNPR